MNFSTLAGNNQIKRQLTQQTQGRGLSHAYIISGPQGSGRHTFANLIAAALVCQKIQDQPCGCCGPCKKAAGGIHPDIITISGPEGKPVSVEQVRSLRTDAHIRPNEAQRKIYLLERADHMNQSAQNAMLKLLEEGPAYAVFLLLAENGGALLETIRSRCESIVLHPLTYSECLEWLSRSYPEKNPSVLQQAAMECQGILGRAVDLLEGTGAAAEQIREYSVNLAQVLECGDELTVFETAMSLEKLSREELIGVLERTVEEIAVRLPASERRGRLLKGVELLRRLRGAVELNANPGQVTGWLCAGLFEHEV